MIDLLNLYNICILLIAGLFAGIVTGLVSASASVIMTPMLSILLGMDIYTALGISLAADVVASLTTTYVYHRHGCVKFEKSYLLLLIAIIFTVVGSYYTQNTSNVILGGMAGLGICMLAIQFFRGEFETRLHNFRQIKIIEVLVDRINVFIVLAGIVIGLNTGIMGAGGGVLIMFTLILGHRLDIKNAIGTSAFTMASIAFCGAAMHFYYGTFPYMEVIVASIGSFIGAHIASHYVHISNEKTVSTVAGTVFSIIGVTMVINQFI